MVCKLQHMFGIPFLNSLFNMSLSRNLIKLLIIYLTELIILHIILDPIILQPLILILEIDKMIVLDKVISKSTLMSYFVYF